MIQFADIHTHLLYGLDDGPKTKDEMWKLFELAYSGGTRFFCLTPHYHAGLYRYGMDVLTARFSELKREAEARFPDACLILGNELRYSPAAVDWLETGECLTMNHTGYVLVDFLEDEPRKRIEEAMYRLLNAGYRPILAHAERYEDFGKDWEAFAKLREQGVLIQLDASSLFGDWSKHAKQMGRALLKHDLVDLVGSDAHNTGSRPPDLGKAYEYVQKHFGAACAEAIFFRSAINLLFDKELKKHVTG